MVLLYGMVDGRAMEIYVSMAFSSVSVAFHAQYESAVVIAPGMVGFTEDVNRFYFGIGEITSPAPSYPAGLVARVLFPEGTPREAMQIDYGSVKTTIAPTGDEEVITFVPSWPLSRWAWYEMPSSRASPVSVSTSQPSKSTLWWRLTSTSGRWSSSSRTRQRRKR